MSVQETRGGLPHIFRADIPTPAGRYHRFPSISKYMSVRTGLTQVKLYFTEADFDGDVNFIGPVNEWEGPVEAKGVWLKGDGGVAEVQMVIYLRLN